MIEAAGYRVVRTGDGTPVSSRHRVAWLRARLWGVTATDARRLVTATGRVSKQRRRLLEAKLTGWEGPRLPQFEHGIEREPVIAAWVQQRFGIAPSGWLCAGTNPRHLATPDGLGEHSIAEIKTSVDDLDGAARTYRDQLQWQLHVTERERVLFVVENRHSYRRDFRWVERDDERIAMLSEHADSFLHELDELRALHVAAGDELLDHRSGRLVQDLSPGPQPVRARTMDSRAG
ncbi:YqaJ viral recombinase family protein [Ruania alba]|uniref:YqaJ-like recombinase domain-containing protein n=1 Tax=Ruania alba TaxID=648782 RepID=A0A1H5FL62_9MICO|nr:YqaJ viral recombinase family protein [Ruania alba]SEE04166.1 YqaJ-like recombinase domain-containing protein [Ruania alba]